LLPPPKRRIQSMPGDGTEVQLKIQKKKQRRRGTRSPTESPKNNKQALARDGKESKRPVGGLDRKSCRGKTISGQRLAYETTAQLKYADGTGPWLKKKYPRKRERLGTEQSVFLKRQEELEGGIDDIEKRGNPKGIG